MLDTLEKTQTQSFASSSSPYSFLFLISSSLFHFNDHSPLTYHLTTVSTHTTTKYPEKMVVLNETFCWSVWNILSEHSCKTFSQNILILSQTIMPPSSHKNYFPYAKPFIQTTGYTNHCNKFNLALNLD